jgi:hypothetical protein
VAQLTKAGASGALDDINATQSQFRGQMGVVVDALKQVIGNANIDAASASASFLNYRYVLYVNPITGSDDYASGNYNANTSPPIVNQQLTCGYTALRPFKTLNRALAEAARLSIQLGSSNDDYDRVVVHCSVGEHIIDNAVADTVVAAWSDGTPSAAQLRSFNKSSKAGLILPRGVSIIGEDLRKTVIRPAFVPASNGNASTGRSAIFRITGGSFFFNFTFKDNLSTASSHHLLSCFEFCNATDLQEYYDKIETAFGLNTTASEIRPGETEIVAPAPAGTPTNATDTTVGSSPYVFNCSVRSDYGLCGIYADGNEVTGLQSLVCAQFTNVSLQKDLSAWELYSGGNWVSISTYSEYINADINNIRLKVSGNFDPQTGTYATDYRSFAFKAIRGAFIQEVSNFVIGDAVHHWSSSGGEISMNNSNSSFGHYALLSDNFRGCGTGSGSLPQDSGFATRAVRRPLQIKTDGTNLRQITLGTLSSNAYVSASGYIELSSNIDIAALLTSEGYSLKEDHYIWIENLNREVGPGYIPGNIPGSTAVNVRAQLAATPFNSATPNRIYVKANGNNNISTITNTELAGNRVFLRRIVDTRSAEEREYALIISNSNLTSSRRPVGNFVFRVDGAGSVANQLDPTNGANEVFIISDVETTTVSAPIASTNYYKVTLRPGDSASSFTANTYYRPADPVVQNNRVRKRKSSGSDASFDSSNWVDAAVLLPDARGIELSRGNIAPQIILDKDVSNDPTSTTLGITFATDSDYLAQLRSSADFIAIGLLMSKLGYSNTDTGYEQASMASKILEPQTSSSTRDWNPADAASPAPNGKLTAKAAWPTAFNRPSLVRAFGQAFEWVGYGNYTKAIPRYQFTTLSDQLRIDALSMSVRGGRVYNTGFTEDGLLVQGDQIRDLSTGRDLSTDSVGLGGLNGDQFIPTYFNSNITIGGTLNVQGATTLGGSLAVTGQVTQMTFASGVLPDASTTQRGIIEIATADEVKAFVSDTLAVTPATLIQALGDAIKSVVNLRLSLSSSSAVPSANQANSTSLYVHPYNGNELALYNSSLQRWYVLKFSGVQTFSLSPANTPNQNYDVYLYNSGTILNPVLAIDFAAWSGDTTPPARTTQDGVICKNNNAERRLVGVLRTTSAGTSTIDLGGTIAAANSASFPRIYLSNLYNTYDARAVYFFGSSWNVTQWPAWSVVPTSVYATNPRISWVQASDTLATAFLDIYNNPGAAGNAAGAVCYVAPGIDSTSGPPDDAFYGEVQSDNSTAGSQWMRALSAGKHDLYYLYKQSAASIVNEHPAHGMIVSIKV